MSLGEGWHNYHHSFPWDHSFSEFGLDTGFNTKFLYFLHNIGWVYDMKRASRNVVYGHFQRHGDGTIGTESSNWSKAEMLMEKDSEKMSGKNE